MSIHSVPGSAVAALRQSGRHPIEAHSVQGQTRSGWSPRHDQSPLLGGLRVPPRSGTVRAAPLDSGPCAHPALRRRHRRRPSQATHHLRRAEHQQRLGSRFTSSRRPRAHARRGTIRAPLRAHAAPVQPSLRLGTRLRRDAHRYLPTLRPLQPGRQYEQNRSRERRGPRLRSRQRASATPLRHPALRGLQPLSRLHRSGTRPVFAAGRG